MSIDETAICVVDDKGGVHLQTAVPTDAEAILRALKPFLSRLRRVGHEAGSLSPWLHPELKARGIPAVCLETRHVRAAMSAPRNKTDAADALGLAHIVRTGWFKAAFIKSEPCYRMRLLLSQRRNLKRKFLDIENSIRHSLKAFGIRLKNTGRGGFEAAVREAVAGDKLTNELMDAMLIARAALWKQYGKLHLTYLLRDGVTKDGAPAQMFGAGSNDVDHAAFAERCKEDRHHFRFIVAPEDAKELSDMKAFTRDLMVDAERDLGTSLDWVAVDHWNTEHPHIHVIVRGRTDDDQDLVISRDYIREGMRARAQQLLTFELGPRSDPEIRHSLETQVGAERWTWPTAPSGRCLCRARTSEQERKRMVRRALHCHVFPRALSRSRGRESHKPVRLAHRQSRRRCPAGGALSRGAAVRHQPDEAAGPAHPQPDRPPTDGGIERKAPPASRSLDAR